MRPNESVLYFSKNSNTARDFMSLYLAVVVSVGNHLLDVGQSVILEPSMTFWQPL